MTTVKSAKRFIRKSPLYKIIKQIYFRLEIIRYLTRGKTPPLPRLLKQQTVRRYARDYRLNTFVETGTYEGDMVAYQLSTFSKIHTIELDPILCKKVRLRFYYQRHVVVHCGDSGEILPQLVAELNEPALFWLDAHYSGGITARGELDTPIIKELRAVLDSPLKHIVLIDDAREFVGKGGYPTIKALQCFVRKLKPNYMFKVQNDIIRIYPYD